MTIETVLSIFALTIAIVAIVIAWRTAHKTVKMTQYTYLANKWYEIKEKEFDNPDFIDQSKTSSYKTSFTGDSLRKYEIFASICWGYVEDIYRNNWYKDPGFKPSLKWYKKLHYTWLKEPENSKRFDSSFIKYINELQ